MARRKEKQEKTARDRFRNGAQGDIRSLTEVGEPNSTKRVKSVMERKILGDDAVIILDVLDRVWVIPEVRNRYGDKTNHVLDHPLELHFDNNGKVEYAVHLHPYHDPTQPFDEVMSGMMNALEANAGWSEDYEGKSP